MQNIRIKNQESRTKWEVTFGRHEAVRIGFAQAKASRPDPIGYVDSLVGTGRLGNCPSIGYALWPTVSV